MPERTNSTWGLDSLPISSVSKSRSSVMICNTLATESFASPVARAGRSTLPGPSAHRRSLVNGTQAIVLIRLRLRSSPWATSTGRRNLAPELDGAGRSAQYRCPWAITIQRFQGAVVPLLKRPDRDLYRWLRKRGSSPGSRRQDRAGQHTPLPPPCRLDFAIFLAGETAVQPHDRFCRGSRWRFSRPKYNGADCSTQTNYQSTLSSLTVNLKDVHFAKSARASG